MTAQVLQRLGRSPSRIGRTAEAQQPREKSRAVEFRVGLQMGGGDGARQHAVGEQHAALALDLGDAAVGGDRARVDVVADNLLVAGIDQDLGERDVLRRRGQAVERCDGEGGEPAERYGPAPAPQYVADHRRVDLSARNLGGGSARRELR